MSGFRSHGFCQTARLLLAVILAALAGALPSTSAHGFDGCSLEDGVSATTCPLRDGATVEGVLGEPGQSATYRLDTFASDVTVELLLTVPDGVDTAAAELAILDWRGDVIGAATLEGDAPEARLSATLPLPGAYAVRLGGSAATPSLDYHLSAKVTYPGDVPQPIWPAALAQGDAPLEDERRLIRVPRGGTPSAGVAAGRIVSPPPAGIFDDFILVADVTFEQVAGPAALQVRFRYEPEAGGGTGYLFSLDPFAGTATLETFVEGRRRAIVADVPLPTMPTTDHPSRLVLSAEGPSITVTLDGALLVDVTDDRFGRGLIAIGAVTWSEPVGVLFDHVQVTAKPR